MTTNPRSVGALYVNINYSRGGPMTGDYGTPYTETEALLAALSSDKEYAEKKIAEMTRRERSDLEAACEALIGSIREHSDA